MTFLLFQLAKYLNGVAALNFSKFYSNFSQAIQKEITSIDRLISSTDLWILPTMNPDGFSRGTEGECFGGRYADGRQNEGRVVNNSQFGSRACDHFLSDN